MTPTVPQNPAFDVTLSLDLFEHISTHMQDLTPKEQATLKNITQGHGEVYSAGPAFKKLLGRSPDLIDRTIEAADSVLSFHNAMAPSLMVWALNQGWVEEGFDPEQMMKKWLGRCLDSRSTQGTIVAASQFMAQLLPLAPHISETSRAHFLAETLEELYRYATPWKYSAPFESSTRYLALSHKLTQLCAKSISSTGEPFSGLWCSKATLTLCEIPSSEKRIALATWLATSSLPLKDRQDVLLWSAAEVWALPCVANLLLPALPRTEHERFAMLSLDNNGNDPGYLNRTLVQTYCPEMFPLIELAMQKDDWGTRQTIAAWVARFKFSEKDTFELPDDCTGQPLNDGSPKYFE